jgi:hypothetical protein
MQWMQFVKADKGKSDDATGKETFAVERRSQAISALLHALCLSNEVAI